MPFFIAAVLGLGDRPPGRFTEAERFLHAAHQAFARPWRGSPRVQVQGSVGISVTPWGRGSLEGLLVSPGGDVVAADARFDDPEGLASELGLAPTASPPELILAAYRRWGESFVDHVDGDFAVVIWDARRSRMVLARDLFGLRPLYLRESQGTFFVASEVDALVGLGSSASVSDLAVIGYLARQWRPSFFEGVDPVAPGSCCIVQDGAILETVTRLRTPLAGATCEAAIDGLKSAFGAAVTARLKDVPRAVVELSGGLDSTSIAALAGRSLRAGVISTELLAVSAVFPGMTCDETPFIEIAASALPFRSCRYDGSVFSDVNLSRPIRAWPGGANPTNLGYGGVEKALSHGADVVLSGLGGDQLFHDLDGMADMLFAGRWRDVVHALATSTPRGRRLRLEAMVRGVASRLPGPVRSEGRRLRALLGPKAGRDPAPPWLTPLAVPLWNGPPPPSARIEAPGQTIGAIQRSMVSRLWGRPLAFDVAAVVRMWADVGIEYRTPLLDRRLIEFALAFPPACRTVTGLSRTLLRQAMQGLVPPAIVARTGKASFLEVVVRMAVESSRWLSRRARPGPMASARWFAPGVLRYEGTTAVAPDRRFADAWRCLAACNLEAWLRGLG